MTTPDAGPGRLFFLCGASLGATAVLLGAFGAHGLQGHIEPKLLSAYAKAVDYQALHALLLLLIGHLSDRLDSVWLNRAGWMVLAGTLLFSGSLYLLALTGIRPLGLLTPFGGIALVFGWLCLFKAWPKSKAY